MPETKTRDKRFLYFFATALIAGILTLFASTIYWPSVTKFITKPTCAKLCHFMEPQLTTWEKSSHAQMSCYSCHIEDIYFGFSTIGPKRVWLTLRNSYKRPINGDSHYSQKNVEKERCLKCHAVFTREISPSTGLKISKESIRKHLDAGLSCTICHNRETHFNAEKLQPISSWQPKFKYLNFMKMKEGCWRCHSDSKVYKNKAGLDLIKGKRIPGKKCSTCHYDNFLLENRDRCLKKCHNSEFVDKFLKKSGVIEHRY